MISRAIEPADADYVFQCGLSSIAAAAALRASDTRPPSCSRVQEIEGPVIHASGMESALR